jgi:hypothetical protein
MCVVISKRSRYGIGFEIDEEITFSLNILFWCLVGYAFCVLCMCVIYAGSFVV